MKRSLVFVFLALFGLSQLAPAKDQHGAKKKQKNEQQAAQSIERSAKAKKTVPAASVRTSAKLQKHQVAEPRVSNRNAKIQAQQRNQQHTAALAKQQVQQRNQRHTAALSKQQAQQLHNQKAAQNARQSAKFRNWRGNNIGFSEAYRRRYLYRNEHHDRHWWHSHYPRIVLFGRGYYYWDAGWWYPAWGYHSSYNTYVYDGPIYAYNDLPPDQVVVNVQQALRQQGYYRGAIDGDIGPLTRAALARYQRSHGLAATAAIDEPTLDSLGMI